MRRITLLMVLLLSPLFSNCYFDLKLKFFEKAHNNQISNSLLQGRLYIEKDKDQFILPLTLGTPPQSFKVMLDTGSFILWVSSVTANNKPHLSNRFDPAASSSYQSLNQKCERSYISGGLTGVYCLDMVSIFKNVVPIKWSLAEKTQTSLSCDGILGMGHHYNSQKGLSENMSLMHQALEMKIIPKNIFSIKRDNSNDAKLFLGGYHGDFYEKDHVASCKLVDSQLWKCSMSHLIMGNLPGDPKYKIIDVNLNAVFDTGSNRIIAPSWMLMQVKDSLPSGCEAQCHNSDYCIIVCLDIHAAPSFDLVFSGKLFKLSSQTLYSYYPEQKVYVCNFYFSKTDIKSEILIGMPFFYNMHVAFDNENQQMKFYSKNIHDFNEALLTHFKVRRDSPWVIALIASALLFGGLLLSICYLRKSKTDKEYEVNVNGVVKYVSNNVKELILS